MRVCLFAALLTGAFAAPAAAHHSAAQFDTSKQVAVEGVVTRYDWRNPHVYMAVRVVGPDGQELEQEIEAGASSVLLPLGLAPAAVAIGEHVVVRGNPSRGGPGLMVLGRELVKADGSVLPLNIRSAPSRATPQNVLATSIAGTWFPQTQGFYGYTESRAKWTLTGRAQEEAAAWSSRSASYTDCIPVTAPLLMLYPVTSVIEIATDAVRMRVDWMASERIIYLDGRGHPVNGEGTLHGHSIGRWEGSTLVRRHNAVREPQGRAQPWCPIGITQARRRAVHPQRRPHPPRLRGRRRGSRLSDRVAHVPVAMELST